MPPMTYMKKPFPPMYPNVMLRPNCLRSAMSFWMVGKEEAPPKENSRLDIPRKSVSKVGDA